MSDKDPGDPPSLRRYFAKFSVGNAFYDVNAAGDALTGRDAYNGKTEGIGWRLSTGVTVRIPKTPSYLSLGFNYAGGLTVGDQPAQLGVQPTFRKTEAGLTALFGIKSGNGAVTVNPYGGVVVSRDEIKTENLVTWNNNGLDDTPLITPQFVPATTVGLDVDIGRLNLYASYKRPWDKYTDYPTPNGNTVFIKGGQINAGAHLVAFKNRATIGVDVTRGYGREEIGPFRVEQSHSAPVTVAVGVNVMFGKKI